jgi:hypothetical protein
MTRAHGPVQPSWSKAPNRGQDTAGPDNPMERRRGPRASSAYTPADRGKGKGKGTGAAPTLGGVAWPKAAVVEVQRR